MEMTLHMTEQRHPDRSERQSITETIDRLSKEGRSWIAAEAAYAKSEVASDGKRVVTMLILAAVAFGSIFSAIIMASLYVLELIAPHVGGMKNSAGLVALVLVLVVLICGGIIWRLSTSELGIATVCKRWWKLMQPKRRA